MFPDLQLYAIADLGVCHIIVSEEISVINTLDVLRHCLAEVATSHLYACFVHEVPILKLFVGGPAEVSGINEW